MPTADIVQSLKAGILGDLKESWRQALPDYAAHEKVLLRALSVSTIRNASYVWKEALPFPSQWPYGKPRSYKTFKDRLISLALYPYTLSVPWSGFDEDDDQLNDLRLHVQQVARRYAMLPTQLTYEYFNGTAVELPALANTYDGASIFSATDGDGAARLGVSGGNILTGSGATTTGVFADIARAQQRFLAFVDPTAGKPIFDEEAVGYKNMVAIIPSALNQVFQKVTQSEYIRVDNTNTVSESNYLKGTFRYIISQFLTDTSDWYVVLDHSYWKPFVWRAPGNIETIIADWNNSDRAREYNEFAIHTHIRTAIGPWFPGTIIKIDN